MWLRRNMARYDGPLPHELPNREIESDKLIPS
jgi:hypothetical protein